jgi:hypothetical protein
MYWTDQPATEQQLLHLKNAGYIGSGPLTQTEAARLIRELRRHPGRVNAPIAEIVPKFLQPKPAPPPSPRAPMSGELSEAARVQAYRLHTAVTETAKAFQADPDGPNVRADAVSSRRMRQEFWLDTCSEVKEMRNTSVQIVEFYQRFGCRFFTPTRDQVQNILDALDEVMPLWDRDHPELFYQTIELNIPELLRAA